MSSDAFDMVRKIRHLPGLNLTATLDPTQVLKRVKTVAQQMLRSGVLHSGYRSKSRMLAEQLLTDAKCPTLPDWHSWGVTIPDTGLLTDDARNQIVQLLNTAKLIEHATSANEVHARDINARYDAKVRDLELAKGGRLGLYMHHNEINKQIAEVAASCRTPIMAKRHNELADKLDSTKPFPVNF